VPSLAVILAYIIELLGIAQSIKSIVESLKPSIENVAVETTPYRIETYAENAALALGDGTNGLEAINTNIGYIRFDPRPDALPDLTSITALISALSNYVLPDNPPIGWTTDITTGVWAQTLEVGQMCALD
jgi:hypothetical protein